MHQISWTFPQLFTILVKVITELSIWIKNAFEKKTLLYNLGCHEVYKKCREKLSVFSHLTIWIFNIDSFQEVKRIKLIFKEYLKIYGLYMGILKISSSFKDICCLRLWQNDYSVMIKKKKPVQYKTCYLRLCVSLVEFWRVVMKEVRIRKI